MSASAPLLNTENRFPEPITVYWAMFSISVLAFMLRPVVGTSSPTLSEALQIMSLVTCGFSWLYARTLFRHRAANEWWPEMLVLALFVSCFTLHIGPSGPTPGSVFAYTEQIQRLLGSVMLALPLIESIEGGTRSETEKRFRRTFRVAFGSIIAVSLFANIPALLPWQVLIQCTLASIALVGATLAWRFRLQHPLSGRRRSAGARIVSAEALELRDYLQTQRPYLNPELRVSDLAGALDQPEYRVSQWIVDELGHRNFNQLVNHYRLQHAKSRLADTQAVKTPILTIALESGFGSIGPFNRAFKAQTGLTPSAYRKQALFASNEPPQLTQ
ncbi:MAG: helix-turn-helix domain-containing protein [Pseudomonadota bacterium]